MRAMVETGHQIIIDEFLAFLGQKEFPCLGAKAALAHHQIRCMVADNMACPKDDAAILQFIYHFVDEFRQSADIYHSAAVLFRNPEIENEELFDKLLWQRLQALANLDAAHYSYDKRVNADPSSARYSFSLKEEAFFIIGMHASSSR